jgi:hypothetical protein
LFTNKKPGLFMLQLPEAKDDLMGLKVIRQ